MFNKISIIILLITGVNCFFAQNGFDNYLSEDSTYYFTSQPKLLNLLLLSGKDESRMDTSFYNSFGKAEVITLNQLLYLTVTNSPELKVYKSKMEGFSKLSGEKSSLPDPMLEIETDNVESNFKKVEMINFYASQHFPYPGKLKLESESALINRGILENEAVNTAAVNMYNVKQQYYELYLNYKNLQLNADNMQLIKVLTGAVESKYAVGKAMQQELLKAQIEMSRLDNEAFILKQSRKGILSELTKLTKTVIDENTFINFSDIDDGYLLDQTSFNFSDADVSRLVDFAFEHRPELKSLKYKINLSRKELEIAELSPMPDFDLKVGYKILPFAERNGFQFMVGINIPFAPWSSGKYKYNIQRNEIEIKVSNEEYEVKQNEIRNEIILVINNMRAAKVNMSYFYNVYIPQTESTLKSTQYSYENNLTSFLDLIDSYRMHQDAEHMYHEALTMYLKLIAELEKVTAINIKK